MRSIILNSGPMHKYAPIGQDGVLVWKSAEAFRNALEGESQLGREITRFLAIPKSSQSGEHLDWFIPFDSAEGRDYEIIRWSSASLEEKKQALEKLEAMAKKLLNYGLDLKAMALTSNDKLFEHFINGTKEGEVLPALHFPDNDCLFIVDGQPVITFWGFTKNRLSLKGAPFAELQHEVNSKGFNGFQAKAASSSATASKSPSFFRQHLWCLLLPLLLLLLFLLLWLLWRYLFPQGINFGGISIPPYEQNFSENKDNLPSSVTSLEELLPKIDLKSLEIEKNPDGTYLVKDNLGHIYTVNKDIVENLAEENFVRVEDPDISGVVPDADVDVLPKDALPSSLDDNASAVASDKAKDSKESIADEKASNNAKNADEKAAIDESAADNFKDVNSYAVKGNNIVDADEPLNLNENSRPPLLSEDGVITREDPFANTKPLNLSESDIAKGTLNNLAGTWRVKSSIVNSSTNKPVNLKYSFDKNGKGKAVIEEQNGVKCYSDVEGKIVDGYLQISNESTAVCSDKSTYLMPKIKCKAGTNNDSSCEAIYSQGINGKERFNIELRQ